MTISSFTSFCGYFTYIYRNIRKSDEMKRSILNLLSMYQLTFGINIPMVNNFCLALWSMHRYAWTKKKFVHKNFATGYWLPLSLFKFFLEFLDQWCWRFSKGYLNNFSTELSSQIFDCCPRNFLIQEERIGNVVSTSHWITSVQGAIHTSRGVVLVIIAWRSVFLQNNCS